MATWAHVQHQNSSSRTLAMVMALVSAILLSPLYMDNRKSESRLETRWSSSGLMLPALVAGLIVAIKTTTSTSNATKLRGYSSDSAPLECGRDDAHLVLKIGSSCWGLAAILILLLFVTSCQASVQHFFWR